MDIVTAISNPIYIEKMTEFAESYGLPKDKGFTLESLTHTSIYTGANRGFALAIQKDGKRLVMTDRLELNPYGFWTRRALKKLVKQANKITS